MMLRVSGLVPRPTLLWRRIGYDESCLHAHVHAIVTFSLKGRAWYEVSARKYNDKGFERV